ncbi:MAG: hypothetical protein E7447_03260 [Ruminococcaceae bacterium]|nr:hypothetical protein [Oscillospiraceae bacterium]
MAFAVGYAELNINPPLGIFVHGYYIERFAEGFLDDLMASCMALRCSDKTILLIAVDNCLIKTSVADSYRTKIAQTTGVEENCIFICASHTHTGPEVSDLPTMAENILEYTQFLGRRLSDVAALALADLQPAKMGFAQGWAPERVAYIRRYKMKDGTTMTCPLIDDPNIDHPIGTLDQRVNVLRFDRESGNSIVLVNYGLHADTINGNLISADWPGAMRSTLEKALDGTKCMFFPGAEGDVGSTNVHPKPGDMNDTEISFDNEMKSPGMARFVGRALAGTVLQVYDKVAYVDVESIDCLRQTLKLPTNMPTAEQLPLAHEYKKLHEEGRDDLIPYEAMELTTVVAEALRMCDLEHGPEFIDLTLTGVRLGNIALVGIPGEPFTDIGVGIKDTEGWDLILPCALTNGSQGYFPMQSAFDEGGYEARTSRYKAGVAERIIQGGKELLEKMKK